jgi:hypothetical protein
VLCAYIIELKLTALEEAKEKLEKEAEKLTTDHFDQFDVDNYFGELQHEVDLLEANLMDFLTEN